MTAQPRYYITDVFAEQKYSGNQLATFVNCASFSEKEMQQIAREIHFSETTFILSNTPVEGGYPVRIFTPEKEVDFAGHPTLGTAYVIARHILKKPADRVVLNLKVGQIPVSFSGGPKQTLRMDQKEPLFGKTFSATALADVLSLPPESFDTRFPVQEVSTGLPHIIVPLKNLKALKSISVDKKNYYRLIEQEKAKCILAFSPECYAADRQVSVRMFADYFGVPEDPATGSGNGCLAGYLVKHRYFQSPDIDILSEQGYELGRPSLLYLRASEKSSIITVSVGGKVIPLAEGVWEQ
ncbi:MAG: PhzF family phenazine biosynthesis protein [Calditrichia bacterium]